MRKAAFFILLLLAVVGAFLAGTVYNQRTAVNSSSNAGRVLYYVDPMHPAYKSDKPGIAPDCGMDLVPVYADEDPDGASVPKGSVRIGPEKQQLIGVRVSRVEKTSGAYKLRLFGRVVPDETRIYKLVAGVDGFIRQVSTITTGSQVQKDQWLATFSAPEARAPIQGFLVTLDTLDRQKQGGGDAPAQINAATASSQLAVDRLLNLGMSSRQIDEIRHTRQTPTEIRILAPADGFVLARNVSVGDKFDRGTEWYRIADLGRVWIVAEVPEMQVQYFRAGAPAQIVLPHQGKSFRARVSAVLPQFDPATRTIRIRLEADNPGYFLRPDMFVDIELPVSYPPRIVVPAEAVLDSGLAATVFVERSEGLFEPRQVETGSHFDHQVEIVSGLEPGERIVVSGNFLLDSESRLRAEAAAKYKAVRDPGCGMEVDADRAQAAGRTSEYRGTKYYFCSEQCKRNFEADPEGYLRKTAPGHEDGSQNHRAPVSVSQRGRQG